MPSSEGTVDFRGHETWYRVTGDLGYARLRRRSSSCTAARGAPHDYTLRIARTRRSQGRAVVHYDQLGCGTLHPPARRAAPTSGPSQLFLDELDNLLARSASPTTTRCSGSPGAGCSPPSTPYASRPGLRALVIADSPASMELWVAEANRLRAELPPDVRRTLLAPRGGRHHRHPGVRRRGEGLLRPPRVPGRAATRRRSRASFAAIDEDPTVYHTMNGPSEFHVIGTPARLVDRRPGGPRSPCRPCWSTAATTRRPRRRVQPFADAHPRRALGDLRATPATCRTSRRRSATCRSSATSSTSTTVERRPDQPVHAAGAGVNA